MMAQPTSPSPRKPSFDLRAGCIDATAGCEKWTSGQILKGETSRYDEIKRRKIVLKKKKREKTTSIRRTQLRFYVFGLYLNVFQLATNSPRYVRVAAIKRPYTSMQVDRHHRQNGCGLWGALRRVANSASFCWTTTTGEGLYIITWIEAHDVDAGHVTTAWKGSRYWTAPLLLWSSPSCEQQQDETKVLYGEDLVNFLLDATDQFASSIEWWKKWSNALGRPTRCILKICGENGTLYNSRMSE